MTRRRTDSPPSPPTSPPLSRESHCGPTFITYRGRNQLRVATHFACRKAKFVPSMAQPVKPLRQVTTPHKRSRSYRAVRQPRVWHAEKWSWQRSGFIQISARPASAGQACLVEGLQMSKHRKNADHQEHERRPMGAQVPAVITPCR